MPCFLLFLFSPLSRHVYFFVVLRLCSSHLLLSASTQYVFFLLGVIRILPHLGIPFLLLLSFLSHLVRISRVVFLLCCRTRCVSTWFAYLDYSATLICDCLTFYDNIFYISLGWGTRKDTGGIAYAVRSEKNSLMRRRRRQQQQQQQQQQQKQQQQEQQHY